MVAGLVGADWLFMLTDVDALYTANPAVRQAKPRARPRSADAQHCRLLLLC